MFILFKSPALKYQSEYLCASLMKCMMIITWEMREQWKKLNISCAQDNFFCRNLAYVGFFTSYSSGLFCLVFPDLVFLTTSLCSFCTIKRETDQGWTKSYKSSECPETAQMYLLKHEGAPWWGEAAGQAGAGTVLAGWCAFEILLTVSCYWLLIDSGPL